MPRKKGKKKGEPPRRQQRRSGDETPPEERNVSQSQVAEFQQMQADNSSHYRDLRQSLADATIGGRPIPDLLAPLENFSNMLLETGMLLASQGLLDAPGQSSEQQRPIDPATREAIARIERTGQQLFSGLSAVMHVMATALDRTQESQAGAAVPSLRAFLESSAAVSSSAAAVSALLESGAPGSLSALLQSGRLGSQRPAEIPIEASPRESEESSEGEESSASKKP